MQLKMMTKKVLMALGLAPTKANAVIVLIVVVLVVAGAAVVFVLKPQGGTSVTGEVAQILLNPTSGNLTPSSASSISLQADSGGTFVDGFQAFIHITGTIPADLAFTPANFQGTGLKVFTYSFSDESAGKLFKLLIITEDPTTPYKANGLIELGKFNLTTPASGQMTFTFDTALTKIVTHDTNSNIVLTPAASVYNFSNATSSSSSSSTTTSSSSSSVSTTSSSSSSSSSVSSTSSAVVTVDLKAAGVGGTASDGPVTIPVNSTVTLSWTTTNATSCTMAASTTTQTGSVATSGTQQIPNITQNTTFTLTCNGVSDSVQVIANINVSTSSSSTSTSSSSSATTSSTSSVSCPSGQFAKSGHCVVAACHGDYNNDGTIAASDFLVFAQNYKKSGISCSLDIVGGNCFLDASDFLAFAQSYKQTNLCL